MPCSGFSTTLTCVVGSVVLRAGAPSKSSTSVA
jgi:hypothetical protein